MAVAAILAGAAPRCGEWLPIETIPQNGDDVLACDKRVLNCMAVVSYDAESPSHPLLTMDGPAYMLEFFTHWTPLPAPPET